MLRKASPVAQRKAGHAAALPAAADLRAMSIDQLYDLAESLAGRPVPGVRMSEAEFVAWCPGELRAEWVDGEVTLMSPANVDHGQLTTWLILLLGMFLESRDLGSLHHDVFVRLPRRRRQRIPDILVILKARLSQLTATYFDGGPDVVFEVISPDSQSRDRRAKFFEYEQAGVREYWIIDPISPNAEAYALAGKKFAPIQPIAGEIASGVLKVFRLKVAELWKRPLPKVAAVLKRLAKR